MHTLDVGRFAALLKATYGKWSGDKAPRLGAALAYYTVFSLAPMLVVLLAIAGIAFDRIGFGGREQVMMQLSKTFGHAGGALISSMIDNADHHGSGPLATAIGTATLLLGAGGLFGQLQDALNTIWGVAPRPGLGLAALLKARFLSFAMVLGTAFLLLVSLVLSTLLHTATHALGALLPVPQFVAGATDFVLGLTMATLLFAMIYKVLPDAEIGWSDVWVGAATTALLFTVGQMLLTLYLARSSQSAAYGAAGALVLVLLWVYYAAQLLFFGAEFTQVYATWRGSPIRPSPNAVAVTAAGSGPPNVLAAKPISSKGGPVQAQGSNPPGDFQGTICAQEKANDETNYGSIAVYTAIGLVALVLVRAWWRK